MADGVVWRRDADADEPGAAATEKMVGKKVVESWQLLLSKEDRRSCRSPVGASVRERGGGHSDE